MKTNEARKTIRPLDQDGRLYTVYDEHGKAIGSGSREVCEVIVHMMTRPLWAQNTLIRASFRYFADAEVTRGGFTES